VSGLREAVSSKRTDLDQRAYELRTQGLTYRAIAKWLGVTLAMARRRVLRHERMLREAAKSAERE
jgi:predicted site-specific integrase-resolvase